jgi:hypothetical protein
LIEYEIFAKIEHGIAIRQQKRIKKETIVEYIKWLEKNYDQKLYEEYIKFKKDNKTK